MTSTDPDEVMAVVARRGDVLAAVGVGGVSKRDLVSSLDISRSTIDRAVRELEGTDLVERTPEGYRRTLAGELALREYRGFADRIGGVLKSRPLLSELAPEARLDSAMLDGCELVRPERHSPNRPVTRLSELVRRADRVRAFAPAVFPQQVDVYRTNIVERGAEAEIVVSDGVVERLVSAYREELSAALDTGRLTLRVATGPLPYSLTVGENADGKSAGIVVYADDGSVKGFIGNDSEDAVEWAESEVARQWRRASPLPRPTDR